MINGWVSEKFGYRYTVLVCLAVLTGLISIFFTAQHVWELQIAEVLCGIPWGIVSSCLKSPPQ